MIQKRNSFSAIYLVHSVKIGYETKQTNKETFCYQARTQAHAHAHNAIQTEKRGIILISRKPALISPKIQFILEIKENSSTFWRQVLLSPHFNDTLPDSRVPQSNDKMNIN